MYEEIHFEKDHFSSLPPQANIIPSSHQDLLDLCEKLGPNHKVISVQCAHCGTVKHFISNCGSRLCIYCRTKSVNRTLNRKGLLGKRLNNLKLLTLTIKSEDMLSNSNVVKIRDYFRKLIRRSFWKKAVTGGIYCIEVTKTKNGFHYHIHVVYSGKFMHWAIIRQHWYDITKGSYIIHVKKATDAKGSMNYLAKYISKVESGQIGLDQYEMAFKGIKLLQYFGSWYKLTTVKLSPICKKCGSSDWLQDRFVKSDKSNSYFHREAWKMIRKAGEAVNKTIQDLFDLNHCRV